MYEFKSWCFSLRTENFLIRYLACNLYRDCEFELQKAIDNVFT
jgi:hypothetical protein